MGAMKVMKKKAVSKAPEPEAMKAMKAMKVMKKKAAMKAMKAMKVMKKKQTGSAMTKSGIAETLGATSELKKSACMKILDHLAEIGTKEVKQNGKFVLPGLVMIKTRVKPATQAGQREMFGKVVKVKAMKARTVVKAFAVSALKKNF